MTLARASFGMGTYLVGWSGHDASSFHKHLLLSSVQVRSQLSKNDRKKFNTVLIVDVHNRDIIDRFVRDR